METVSIVGFFDALVRYEIELWAAVDRELEHHDQIRLASLHALRLIQAREGRARVQELSEDIGITVGAVSKLIDRLERDGLAERTPNPANRRSSLIGLTPDGQQAVASAMVVFDQAVRRAVGTDDVATTTEVLQQLQSRLAASGVGVAA